MKIKSEGANTTVVRMLPETVAKLEEIKAATGLSANEIFNRTVTTFEVGSK